MRTGRELSSSAPPSSKRVSKSAATIWEIDTGAEEYLYTVLPDAYPSVTGSPKNRNRLRNSPTLGAPQSMSLQFSPPSVVWLLEPLAKSADPQPPTQPRLSLAKPIPSRLALACMSLIRTRRQDCPPSVVLRIAPSQKFSSETKPT